MALRLVPCLSRGRFLLLENKNLLFLGVKTKEQFFVETTTFSVA